MTLSFKPPGTMRTTQMKTNKTVIAGAVVALLGAGLLALFVAQAAGGGGQRATAVAYVAAEPLTAGMDAEEIRSRVEQTRVPTSLAAERRVTDFADIEGQRLLRALGEGEILHADQFAHAGPASGGLVVPSGYEAISVEAEPAPGAQGYVTPGSRVNIYVTVDDGDGAAADGDDPGAAGGDSYTQRVLGHVDVLAVTPGTLTGESSEPSEGGNDGRIVLLLQLAPDDAPVLVHAEQRGALWFSVVNPDDEVPDGRRVDAGDFAANARTDAIRAAADERARSADAQAAREPAGGDGQDG